MILDCFYPRDASGKAQKCDDLPARYQAHVDVLDASFDRKCGDQPPVVDEDIQDIIASTGTLVDGCQAGG